MSSVLDLENLIFNIDEQLGEVIDKAALVEQQAAAAREEVYRYILLEVGGLRLAININHLSEVGPLPTITVLPNLPAWIQGIVNIRSEIVSVIDLNGFLAGVEQQLCKGNRLAVLRYKKRKIGVRVDRIIGTVSRAESETRELDTVQSRKLDSSLFSSGVLAGDSFYYILNVTKFLVAPRLVEYNSKR